MKVFFLLLQVILGVGLVAAVLLHTAKGEGLGGIGGQARIFGSQKGLEEGLDKITYVLAGAFLVISLVIGIIN